MSPTHLLIEVKRVDRDTIVTMKCGVVVKARSRAEAFEGATAWHSLATCPGCLRSEPCPPGA